MLKEIGRQVLLLHQNLRELRSDRTGGEYVMMDPKVYHHLGFHCLGRTHLGKIGILPK